MSEFAAPWGNYLVADLVPTAVPQLVSVWPQTLGWQLVFIAFLSYVAKKIYLFWQAYQRNTYRREALAWLSNLPVYSSLKQQGVYRQLPALLRKTALQAYGREEISQLSNEQWEHWLDQQCDKTAFSQQCAKQLHVLTYAIEPNINPQQMRTLLTQISLWIKFHRRCDD